jgi:UDP-N-acetyl-D-galactosamine dehydrogenase
VLEAAGTKWNFLPFRPGLVGGHCIGVDPYYLTHKAQEIGYHPEMILAGRRLNDNMSLYVAGEVVKLMTSKRIHVKGARILVLGLTFKENCPDLRNSKVIDVIRELRSYGLNVYVHDPVAAPEEAHREYGVELVGWNELPRVGAIVAAVSHRALVERPVDQVLEKLLEGGVYADVKCTADLQALRARGIEVWRL